MNQTPTPTATEKPARKEVAFDWREWLPHLAESDLTDSEKQAMIEALWSIVLCFVDMGFDVKTAAETCGEAIDLKAALAAAMLNSKSNEEDAA